VGPAKTSYTTFCLGLFVRLQGKICHIVSNNLRKDSFPDVVYDTSRYLSETI
jgi:hypothetical protein